MTSDSVGADRPGVEEADAGRDLEAAIVAEEGEARILVGKEARQAQANGFSGPPCQKDAKC